MVGAVLLTCVVAATSLALTYEVTRDRIAAQERAAEERALRAVVPDAEGFEVADDVLEQSVDAAQEIAVTAVYRALGPEGNVVAWGVRVAPRGYAGPIQLVVGLDRDGEVLGVSIISMTETPGLGTKIATVDGWLDQFIGWSGADINASAREFDAIAGATKSSVAVREGVVAAGRVWSAALSGREEVDAP